MADQKFAVVFHGRTTGGADPARVRANLAKLFKADPARIEAMFSGKRAVIKTGVDEATARSYQAALAKAGAMAEIAPVGAEASAAPAPPPAPPPPEKTADARGAAPNAGALAEAARAAPPRLAPDAKGELPPPPVAPDYGVAEPGAQLGEPVTVEPANIATGHLEMAEVGVDLVDYERVAEPTFDLSGLALDPLGTPLSE